MNNPSPPSILVPFGVALVAVVILRVTGHPEGVTDVYTLLGMIYSALGWRAALPVPPGGGALMLDKAAVQSVASGRFPSEVLGTLPRLAQQVIQLLELRGVEIPKVVRDRITDATEGELWVAITRAGSVQHAEDVLAGSRPPRAPDAAVTAPAPAAATQPYAARPAPAAATQPLRRAGEPLKLLALLLPLLGTLLGFAILVGWLPPVVVRRARVLDPPLAIASYQESARAEVSAPGPSVPDVCGGEERIP